MFQIVMLFSISCIMFAAMYQFWFNKNDVMMMMMMVMMCKVYMCKAVYVFYVCVCVYVNEFVVSVNL